MALPSAARRDLAQALHVTPGLGVGDRFVEAVEDQKEMAFPIQVEKRLRVERLRGKALEVLGEEAFKGDGGGAAFAEVDEDRDSGLSGLVFGADGAIPRKTPTKGGLPTAEVSKKSQERASRPAQPFVDSLRELPGQELLARSNTGFEDCVLLDIEAFERGPLEGLDGRFDVGAEVHKGQEELLVGEKADEFSLGAA